MEATLSAAKIEREDITTLAIGIGPGSYTGIRLAISLAQGWELARPIQTVAISSADCLAAQAQEEGLLGKVAIFIDAQRGDFYLAHYEITAQDFREIEPLRLAAIQEVEACGKLGLPLIGPDVAEFPIARKLFPQAATIARLAFLRTNFVPAQSLQPIYLREISFVKAPPPLIQPFPT